MNHFRSNPRLVAKSQPEKGKSAPNGQGDDLGMRLREILTGLLVRAARVPGAGNGFPLLLLFALLLGTVSPALAVNCSDPPYFGVIDGNVVPSPPQIQIDTNCTIRNFQPPNALNTNFSFFTQPGGNDERWLVVFDNVVHTGNMACNNVAGHKVWFTNGSSTNIQEGCQNLLIPVEKIDKQRPAPYAAIGVPFTYRLTIPVLYDPATSGVINNSGSLNTLHGVTLVDDLNATGAALTYVSHVAYWQGSGTPVPHTFSNAGGVLTFSNFPIIPAGQQLVIELTVVLDDTPANAAGNQFTNMATWEFGRLIEGVFYTPLPGEWGLTTMTIAAPELVVTKTGPATMNLGEWGQFAIEVRNTGLSGAWNVTLLDRLPDGATGGMCDMAPQVQSARVFATDGVTPVSAPLVQGADFSFSYNGAPACELTLTMLTAAARIGPSERLIINYQSQLDSDSTNGIPLTNVAGVTRWFSGDSSLSSRRQYDKGPLTNGTPGILDFQDSETVTTALTGYYFQKTVGNLTSGANPATTAAPGDRLRYRVRLFNVDQTINGITISDLLNPNSFDLTTFAMVLPPPAGTTYSFDASNGLLTISGNPIPLNVAAGGELAIEFEITLKSTLTNGMVVDNQATLSASGLFAQSDDPNINGIAPPGSPGDPTRVSIQAPLVARKTVSIANDMNSDGIVDPGDALLYTLVVNNPGLVPAIGVVLTDEVPANTTYVAGSLTLNGLPAGQPDGGILPLISGMAINSAGSAGGTIDAGSSAVVTFRVQVNAGLPVGTMISNRGFVTGNDLPTETTDADGDADTGDQPTTVVVGSAQQVTITKEVFVKGGGAALPAGELEYVVRVTNTGTIPATNLVITDDLTSLAGKATYVAGSALLNNAVAGVNYAAPLLTADYATTYGNLLPGATATLRFRVLIESGLATGTRLTNIAQMAWGTPTLTAIASVSIDIGGVIGSASLSGQVWHDANLNKLCDDGETDLAGWTVGVYRNNVPVATVAIDTDGLYSVSGLEPTMTAIGRYELRFTAPGAGPNTASMGQADSAFTNGPQRISDIVASSGDNLQNLNLPITPNGAVYDSVQRTPVAGATLAMLNGATNAPLPSGCFDAPLQQNQITAANGFYKFDLNFSDASCPTGGVYLIEVTPPGSGYAAAPSRIIPPNGSPAAPFSVPACPGSAVDAIPATAEYCEVTASASVPPSSIPPRTNGTTYHLYLALSNGPAPGQSQVFNNHIPIDPVLNGAVAITKTSSLINVTKGQLVPYTITVKNVLNAPLYDLTIMDRFPAGFKYVAGSARLDNEPREPRSNGQELIWDGLELQFDAKRALQLLLVAGAGVSEGEYVNRAQVLNSATNGSVSEEATATVRVIPDPTFDCTDVIGKVFDDRNLDGQQDKGERGLPGVRVVTARGLIATTDEHGRFHVTCAMVPDEIRGSNFILKLDDRTLPTGYRVTTENPLVKRATRGKMLRFNFGATIHHVVSLDIADGAFEPKSTELRMQWQPRVDILLKQLRKAPSVLRLAYLADVENEGLVKKRLKALKKEITRKWDGGYRLSIETEVFWRRGSPP